VSSLFAGPQVADDDPYGVVDPLKKKQYDVPPAPTHSVGNGMQDDDPLSPPKAVAQQRGDSWSSDGRGGQAAASAGEYHVNVRPPEYQDVPKANAGEMMRHAGAPGGLLSIIGGFTSNDPQRQAAIGHNAREQQRYQDEIERARIEGQAHSAQTRAEALMEGYRLRNDASKYGADERRDVGLDRNKTTLAVGAGHDEARVTTGAGHDDVAAQRAAAAAQVQAARAGRQPTDFENYQKDPAGFTKYLEAKKGGAKAPAGPKQFDRAGFASKLVQSKPELSEEEAAAETDRAARVANPSLAAARQVVAPGGKPTFGQPHAPIGGAPAAAPAVQSGLPPPPHAPAPTATGYKPNWRYKINGKEVQTDAQGNIR